MKTKISTKQCDMDAVCLSKRGIVRGFNQLLVISLLFVTPFGIAFGAASVEQGFTAWQSIVMSVFVFAGASQFAVLEVWQSPIPYLQIAIICFVVNARHIILGAALSPWINRLSLKQQLYAIIVLSDANFANSKTRFRNGENDVGILLGGGIVLWLVWVIGTVIGAYLGTAMGSLQTYGIDVVMMSFFAALTVADLKTRYNFFPIAIACLVAVLTMDVLPSGMNIIVAAFCGGFIGMFRYDK